MKNVLPPFKSQNNLPGPSSYKCEYCNTRVINNYCSSCRSHFVLKDGEQKYISVEMDDLEYLSITDKLCPPCSKYYNTKNIIKASSFTDYIKKLKFCAQCKTSHLSFIRNMFYKNFILYRCRENTYTHGFIMIFVLLFFLTSHTSYFYYLYFLLNYFSYSYIDLLMCLILFLGRKSWFLRYLYLGYNCYSMSCKTKYYFYMPVNMEKEGIKDKHIERLTI